MKHRNAKIAGLIGVVLLGGGSVAWRAGAFAGNAPLEKTASAMFLTQNEQGKAKVDAAQASAKRAPNDARAQAQLGNAYLADRRFREAAAAYERSVAIDPARGEVWSALGEARMQLDRSTDARMPPAVRAAFDRAMALNPRDARARFYRTMEKDFLGQHDEAIGEWLQLLREVPVGSDADEAIRTTITASVNRNAQLIARGIQEASQAQPRAKTKS